MLRAVYTIYIFESVPLHNDGFYNGCFTKRCLHNSANIMILFHDCSLLKLFVIFWTTLVILWRESLSTNSVLWCIRCEIHRLCSSTFESSRKEIKSKILGLIPHHNSFSISVCIYKTACLLLVEPVNGKLLNLICESPIGMKHGRRLEGHRIFSVCILSRWFKCIKAEKIGVEWWSTVNRHLHSTVIHVLHYWAFAYSITILQRTM